MRRKDYFDSLPWYWTDTKKSINGTLGFKLDIEKLPDLSVMRKSMSLLSDKYPSLKSSLGKKNLAKIVLVNEESENIFVRDQSFRSLDAFIEAETNHNFVLGERLYYVAFARLEGGAYGVVFNAHHVIGDAVVHSSLARLLLDALLNNKQVDISKLDDLSSLVPREPKWHGFVAVALSLIDFSKDFLQRTKRLPKNDSSSFTKVHRFRITKDKAEKALSKSANSSITAAITKSFSDVYSFENQIVKSIHLANIRNNKQNMRSKNFALAKVSGFYINLNTSQGFDDLIDQNKAKIKKCLISAQPFYLSWLQSRIVPFLSLIGFRNLSHLGFSNTADFYTSIVDSYDSISDVVASPTLGRMTPYISSILIEGESFWDIVMVSNESYVKEQKIMQLEKRVRHYLEATV